MKKTKRIIALVMALAITFTFMAMSVSAVHVDDHGCHECASVEGDSIAPRAITCPSCLVLMIKVKKGSGYVWRCPECHVEFAA